MAHTRLFMCITMVLISATTMVNTSKLNNSELDIPSLLFFGDSFVDTGNNNYIHHVTTSLLKANRYPYGKDFPGHVANGRFSNGKLVPDFLASFLNLKQTLPPFLHPNLPDEELLTGVNFASSGSGIDDLTFSVAKVIPLSKQINYCRTYVQRLKRIAGEGEAEKILEKALVFISSGNNDFILNFYDLPITTRRLEFINISTYQDFLLTRLQTYIQHDLYEVGLRRIAVIGAFAVGCLPVQMSLSLKQPKCVEKQNSDAKLYNSKLEKLLPQLQQVLPGSRLVFADLYTKQMDMITHPTKYGFEKTNRGCCGSGLVEAGPLCNKLTPTCEDASKYFYWDSIHPTEATCRYFAQYLEHHVLPNLQHHSS